MGASCTYNALIHQFLGATNGREGFKMDYIKLSNELEVPYLALGYNTSGNPRYAVHVRELSRLLAVDSSQADSLLRDAGWRPSRIKRLAGFYTMVSYNLRLDLKRLVK